MASQAHAIFCFETLAAQLERRPLPSLAEIEASWEEYTEASTAHESLNSTPSHSSSAHTGSTPLSDSSSSSTSFSNASPSSSSSSSLSPPNNASTPSSSLLSKALHNSKSRNAPEEAPLFITWNTISPRTNEKHLRGCIGTFSAQPLEEGLRTYALTAALEDTRFSPIPRSALPSLECAVTLLTDFEECSDPYDWVLGEHGLRIAFRDASIGSRRSGNRYSATYLPDVAPEQGWSQEETLQSLVRKAGWTGRRDSWRTGTRDFAVTRYRGRKVGVSAGEWETWRAWHEAK